MKALTEQDYINAAKLLNCEVAAIKAVASVEGKGSGYNSDGSPKILFEGHLFWRELKSRGINPSLLVNSSNANILYQKWTKNYYKGGIAEHSRLKQAIEINREAALESASYGMFQILGDHWARLGYNSLQEFINDAFSGEESKHLEMFVKFIKTDKRLITAIRNKDWSTFAYYYNGSGYKANNYDVKMANAYMKFKQG